MNELELLKQRVAFLEGVINDLLSSSEYTIRRPMHFYDGQKILVGTSSGLKIGTATTQKLGFYNATPVVQASAITAPTTPSASYVQSEAASAVSAINSLRTALSNIGITA